MSRKVLILFVLLFSSLAIANNPQIELNKCFVKGVKSQALCGIHSVPEDSSQPISNDNKVDLNIVVLPKFKEESTEYPVMFLAGGPGQAATELAGVLNRFLNQVRQQHDIILVDQRGTGKSSPLKCDGDTEDYLAIHDDVVDTEQEVKSCLEQHNDKYLPSYNTYQAIEDFEAVRIGLGHEKVHLYGGSYGTRSGFAYLKNKPDSVASAVMDSTAPMQLAIGFFGKTSERAFDLLIEDCKAHEKCHQAFPNLKNDYLSLISQLDKAPITETIYHPRSGDKIDVYLSKRKVIEAIRSTLYNLDARQMVPYLVTKAARGDVRPLASLVDQTGNADNEGGLYTGLTMNIICNEDIPRAKSEDFSRDDSNYFSGELGYSNFTSVCEHWPKWQAPDDFAEPLKTDIPVLLISGKYDPVTPPSYGDMALETLTNAKHVVLPFGSHTPSIRFCDKMLSGFFKDQDFEKLDLECAEKPRTLMFFTNANELH